MKNFKHSSIIFFLTIGMDQFLKWIMVNRFETTVNSGIIFGNLAGADPLIRTVFFSTFFILVLFATVFIQFYFLRDTRYLKLHLSLSLFAAGISGNAFDRIRLGHVIDYVPLFNDYIFNFADAVQLIGMGFCLFFLFRLRNELWPHDDARGFSLIDRRYQMAFSFKLGLISFFSMLMTGTFSYTFLKVYLAPAFDARVENIFIVSWSLIGLLLIVCSVLIGLVLSARTVGPIYALERFIAALKRGEKTELRLRSQDSFQRLEKLSEEIRKLISKQD